MGKLFIVSVVVVASQRATLIEELEKIERVSGKGTVKWIHTKPDIRLAYIRAIFSNKKFIGTMFFSVYSKTKSYTSLTILSTAKAILATPNQPTLATVYVDGLQKAHVHKFGSDLRNLNVQTRKIIGVRREQSFELIRLADSCCGFVRLALSSRSTDLARLFKMALEFGYIKEV